MATARARMGPGGCRCRRRLAGMSVLYVVVMLTMLLSVVTLAVDWARVELSRTQLRAAVDAAARYGAAALPSGPDAVRARVKQSALENTVDTMSLTILDSDVEFGVWDSKNRVFQLLTGADEAGATAIRVNGRRLQARGTGVPTVWSAVFGRSSKDLEVSAVAARGRVMATDVQADACPWLAGMPSGSTVAATGGNNTPSVAPNNCPSQVTGLPIVPGATLSFRQATGTTTYTAGGQGSGTQFGPDGNTNRIVAQDPVNGINTTYAPLNSLVGIFLDDNAPSSSAVSSTLDFTSSAARDFSTLSPGLKQVFFIGDGLDSSGNLQSFVVPSGATRLYLGIMDEKGWWWDNVGTINITTVDTKVTIVK